MASLRQGRAFIAQAIAYRAGDADYHSADCASGGDVVNKHTPGPWGIETAWNSGPMIKANSDLNRPDITHARTIARVTKAGFAYTSTEANARLIAAAPELLEASRAALAALSQPSTFPADVDAAKTWLRDAIRKAEGSA
jgi:hypothetical protein